MPPYETNKPIGVILFDINGDPVDLGGGVGENVTVTNFPSSYPLPDDQLIALTPPAAITGFSTEATLAAVLAKIIATPSTEAKQDDMILALADLGSQATLGDILAKLSADPATESKQDDGNALLTSIEAKDFATEVTLAAVLAKIIAAPATEAKQDIGNTSLADILAKIIAAPSTEAKQDALIALLTAVDFAMDSTLQDVVSGVATSNSWLEAIYGIDFQVVRDDAFTAAAPDNATVNTTSSTVVSANGSRKGLIITNISSNNQIIFLAFGTAAILNKGIVLYPGSTYSMGRFDKAVSDVRAIASAAAGTIAIQEYS